MPRIHIVMLSLLGVAAPLAFGQPPTNEGPKSVPKAESPNDAEHVPTPSNAVKNGATDKDRTTSKDKDKDKDKATSSATRAPKGTDKGVAGSDDRTQGAQSPEDAEHAPTRRTGDDKDKGKDKE
jgi:hypothetical protein